MQESKMKNSLSLFSTVWVIHKGKPLPCIVSIINNIGPVTKYTVANKEKRLTFIRTEADFDRSCFLTEASAREKICSRYAHNTKQL